MTQNRLMMLIRRGFGAVVGAMSLGCHDLVAPANLPPGTQNPSLYDTPSGAEQQAMGALAAFRVQYGKPFDMTDELVNPTIGGDVVDQRQDVGSSFDDPNLNNARLWSNLAQQALAKFSSATPHALRAEVLAAQGYTELLLADRYCSGVPLSTLDFEGTFTYDPGHTTAQVYQHAVSLFEEALPLTEGRDSVATLARVGWGRALLGQGLFDSAAHVVAGTADNAAYTIRTFRRDKYIVAAITNARILSIADHEGRNGMAYRSSYDPRVVVARRVETSADVGLQPVDVYYPASDSIGDSVSITIASGIEAHLIQAEAVLQRALRTNATADINAWIDSLNKLRTAGTFTGRDSLFQLDSVGFDDATGIIYQRTFIRVDTLWQAGTGGVARLALLRDPGTGLSTPAAQHARVALMFKERAFWLFLGGQRQGDMRRLIRQYGTYGFTQANVYPVGGYPGGGTYGTAVNLPVSDAGNLRFHGCKDRSA